MLICRLVVLIFFFNSSLFASSPGDVGSCHDYLFSKQNAWLPSDDSILNRSLSKGLIFYRTGKIIQGENEFYKWLVLKDKLKNTELEDVRLKVKDCLKSLRKSRVSMNTELEIPKDSNDEKKPEKEKKIRAHRIRSKKQFLGSVSISTRALVLKADKFRKSGQLEESLRLYQLAQKMDPSDVTINKTIGELKNEIGF